MVAKRRAVKRQTDPSIGGAVTISNPKNGSPPTRIPGGSTKPGQLTNVRNPVGTGAMQPRSPGGYGNKAAAKKAVAKKVPVKKSARTRRV